MLRTEIVWICDTVGNIIFIWRNMRELPVLSGDINVSQTASLHSKFAEECVDEGGAIITPSHL